MAKSILDAIQSGERSYEPNRDALNFQATDAEPGSREKLEILARRIRQGLPLWHPEDRHVEDELLRRLVQVHEITSCVGAGELVSR